MYVVSCNTAGSVGTPILESSVDGGSKIIDYRGHVLAETGAGESMATFAEIDLVAIRRYRQRLGSKNLLSRQRLNAYGSLYSEFGGIYPANTMQTGPIERSHFKNTQQKAIKRMGLLGIPYPGKIHENKD